MWFDDSAHAAIFSPASNFMIADVYRDSDGSRQRMGLELANLPKASRIEH